MTSAVADAPIAVEPEERLSVDAAPSKNERRLQSELAMTKKMLSRISARYDAALTTDENANHWQYTDGLSAAAANSPDVRRTLRERARYEVANNSYASGMIRTMANEVIGTGPRLQINSEGDPMSDRKAEQAFMTWAHAVRLALKLRIMEMMIWQDGEIFGLMSFNGGLRNPVKMDLKLYEADQVARPWQQLYDPQQTDGIILDDWGNPAAYTVLKYHPGDVFTSRPTQDYDIIRAEFMVHRFLCERPGQVRGVPGLLASLPLFAQLRRYTLAVIAAAETAADLAVLLQTATPADDPDDLEPLDAFEIERRMAMTLPKGWQASQLKAEQPTTAYQDFKHEIINEIARPMNMPYNIAASNSKDYNYSSGRLDHQVFYKFIKCRRFDTEIETLERLLPLWWEEAWLLGLLPEEFDRYDIPEHTWQWDGQEEIDPEKGANADIALVEAGLKSEDDYHSRGGRDAEQVNAKIAKELGITPEELKRRKLESRFPMPTPAAAPPTTSPTETANV